MPDHHLNSYHEIIAHYRAQKQPKAANELRWFRMQPSLLRALRLAGLARGPRNKRFRHQSRLRNRTLAQAAAALEAQHSQIETVSSFAGLFRVIDETIRSIHGIGELMVYDTAIRIGAKRGFEPDAVYLHAGTRQGAAALGFDRRCKTLPVQELPGPFASLTASEAEDVLCIYKDDLQRLARAAV